MKLERDPFYEVCNVVRAAYDIGSWSRGSRTDSHCPLVCVVGMGERLSFLFSEDSRSVAVYYRTKDSQALY